MEVVQHFCCFTRLGWWSIGLHAVDSLNVAGREQRKPCSLPLGLVYFRPKPNRLVLWMDGIHFA